MGQSPISKMLRHLFLEMFGLSLTAPLSANERIAEFLDFAIQAKFAYVNKLRRRAPSRLRWSENFVSKKEKTKQEKRQWVVTVVILSFVLSVLMSVLTSLFVDSAGLLVALLALIVLISIGVITDVIGTAVTSADEQPFIAGTNLNDLDEDGLAAFSRFSKWCRNIETHES